MIASYLGVTAEQMVATEITVPVDKLAIDSSSPV